MNRLFVTCMIVSSMAATTASASTLLLDLGSTTAYNGTNDPAHMEGTVSNSNTDWKAISDLNSQTVLDSDGGSIKVDLGRNTNDTSEGIDLDRPTTLVSSTSGTGIYATDLTNDGMISYPSTAFNRDPIGAEIIGLPTGSYYVYVVAHYAGDTGTTFNVLAGSTNKTADGNQGLNDIHDVYDLFNSDTLEGGNSSAWVCGTNYARFTVSLSAGSPNLIVAADQGDGASSNSTLSAIVITSVPEPASLLVLGSGALLLGCKRRRVLESEVQQ